jgi:hypothetical protein
MMNYYIFKNLDDCKEALKLINEKKGFGNGGSTHTWAEPLKNQIKDEWAIPFDENQIGDCVDLLTEGEKVQKDEAIALGWYFGFFSGPFAREREKLEDIHFIFDGLINSYGNPNFPATRSLVFSFLSACYSLKESLSKKIKSAYFEQEVKEWWNIRKAEQDERGSLLKEYDIFMNTEKHGGASAGQTSNIKLEPVAYMTSLIVTHHHPHADPQTMTMSSEGAFMTAYKETPMERRFPVGIHEAKYEIRVSGAPKTHLNENIEGSTFLDQMTLIRNYYMQVLFDAEKLAGVRKISNKPAIQFSGTQFMETK